MKRVVSIWLPMWPAERLARHHPSAVPDDVPLALVESGAHGIRITAVNACAAREGVRTGVALADARAALPCLLSRTAEPGRDRAALRNLARWAGRYGPSRNIDGADGIWIDATGVAHLFGGEERMLEDIRRRLAGFGFTARAAIAGTFGAAHGLARFGGRGACRSEEERAVLAPLPVEALRLDGETVTVLKRLGLRRIGQLTDLPRVSLERRFSSEAPSKSKARDNVRLASAVLARLDQALGIRDEPLKPMTEPPVLSCRCTWGEPLISPEVLENETGALARELGEALKDAALGCRRIRLTLYRADGSMAEIAAGLSSASRDAGHFVRLLMEKLAEIDAGFGIDAAVLDALVVEPLGARQVALGADAGEANETGVAALVDRLSNRLGAGRITCLVPVESHIPERAERRTAALYCGAGDSPAGSRPAAPRSASHRGEPPARATGRGDALRPPFLLSPPEPISVMAEVPEGPPRHFTWRRVRHRVVKANGPERLAPEWWKELGAHGRPAEGLSQAPARARDYYRIEDETGAGFWVFREGLYQDAEDHGPPAWFLHGLFG